METVILIFYPSTPPSLPHTHTHVNYIIYIYIYIYIYNVTKQTSKMIIFLFASPKRMVKIERLQQKYSLHDIILNRVLKTMYVHTYLNICIQHTRYTM